MDNVGRLKSPKSQNKIQFNIVFIQILNIFY